MLQVRDWFRRKASKDPLQRRDLPLRYEISEFYYNLINLWNCWIFFYFAYDLYSEFVLRLLFSALVLLRHLQFCREYIVWLSAF